MASGKKRAETVLPSPQPGQRLISSYFTTKSDSVIEGTSQTSGYQTPGLETSSTSGNFGNSNSKRPRLVLESPEKSSSRVATNGKSAKKSKKPSEALEKFPELSEKIMENIFCQIPIKDLMLSCALVCQKWRKIIAEPSVSCKLKLIFQAMDLAFFLGSVD